MILKNELLKGKQTVRVTLQPRKNSLNNGKSKSFTVIDCTVDEIYKIFIDAIIKHLSKSV